MNADRHTNSTQNVALAISFTVQVTLRGEADFTWKPLRGIVPSVLLKEPRYVRPLRTRGLAAFANCFLCSPWYDTRALRFAFITVPGKWLDLGDSGTKTQRYLREDFAAAVLSY